jgi:hypothetical protein
MSIRAIDKRHIEIRTSNDIFTINRDAVRNVLQTVAKCSKCILSVEDPNRMSDFHIRVTAYPVLQVKVNRYAMSDDDIIAALKMVLPERTSIRLVERMPMWESLAARRSHTLSINEG